MSAARRGEGDHFLGKDVVLGLPRCFPFPRLLRATADGGRRHTRSQQGVE